MNWKKLVIGITIINLLGWAFLELWIYRYADGVAQWGSFWLIFIHLAGYYIIAIGSRLPDLIPPEPETTPVNCAEHDWHPSKSLPGHYETCVRCGAERGKESKEN